MRTGLAISALAHAAIALSVYATLASPRLFGPHAAEAITVDIVSSDEVPGGQPAPQSAPTPPAVSEPQRPAVAQASPSLAAVENAATIEPAREMMRLEPGAVPAPPANPPMQEATRLASLLHVPMPDGTPEPRKDGLEAPAIAKAKLTPGEIAAFRARVRQCWIAPAGLGARQQLRLVIRLTLRPDGALTGEPMLLEASASPQGPLLLKSLIAALQRCQPYTVLPAQKYKEWRVLDVSFSPQDLTGS